MHFILNFNIIAILEKRRLVRVDNPFPVYRHSQHTDRLLPGPSDTMAQLY